MTVAVRACQATARCTSSHKPAWAGLVRIRETLVQNSALTQFSFAPSPLCVLHSMLHACRGCQLFGNLWSLLGRSPNCRNVARGSIKPPFRLYFRFTMQHVPHSYCDFASFPSTPRCWSSTTSCRMQRSNLRTVSQGVCITDHHQLDRLSVPTFPSYHDRQPPAGSRYAAKARAKERGLSGLV